tara:strand:- start:233 stop:451 length:219 start_codon:yes stop_codon:yes gene_type:complete
MTNQPKIKTLDAVSIDGDMWQVRADSTYDADAGRYLPNGNYYLSAIGGDMYLHLNLKTLAAMAALLTERTNQ